MKEDLLKFYKMTLPEVEARAESRRLAFKGQEQDNTLLKMMCCGNVCDILQT
jgi:hypothetical protein